MQHTIDGSKPPLLFLSPVIPSPGGSGIAMRAAMVLEALAVDHAVHLLVLPVVAGAAERVEHEIAGRCEGVVVQRVSDRADTLFSLIARVRDSRERFDALLRYPKPLLTRFATASAVARAAEAFGETEFSDVHVFRLYLAPFAEPWHRRGVRCWLDLDDHESRTRRRVAALHASAGDADAAALERAEGERYAAMEARELPRFERVYVCSAADRDEVAGAYQLGNVAVVPNVVRLPAAVPPLPPEPFTFLFVGTLGYFPNDDAAFFFCSEVLPRLRSRATRAFRVVIAGRDPSPRLRRIASQAGVTAAGAVPDVATVYAEAHAVIVPLRAGGGTRIKILEAFAYQRPVVSTTLGAEGIAARHEEHALIADEAEAFAAACARLMEEPAMRDALVARALDLVRRDHTPAALLEALRRARAIA